MERSLTALTLFTECENAIQLASLMTDILHSFKNSLCKFHRHTKNNNRREDEERWRRGDYQWKNSCAAKIFKSNENTKNDLLKIFMAVCALSLSLFSLHLLVFMRERERESINVVK
jgi:hypothetical protein